VPKWVDGERLAKGLVLVETYLQIQYPMALCKFLLMQQKTLTKEAIDWKNETLDYRFMIIGGYW